MPKPSLEATVQQNTKDIDRHGREIEGIRKDITTGMEKMVASMDGLRSDMSERAEAYLAAMNVHALEDSDRFGKLETKMALYVGMGMCFAVFAKDIIGSVAASVGHP